MNRRNSYFCLQMQIKSCVTLFRDMFINKLKTIFFLWNSFKYRKISQLLLKKFLLKSLKNAFKRGVCKTRTGYLRMTDADFKKRIDKCGKRKMRITKKTITNFNFGKKKD